MNSSMRLGVCPTAASPTDFYSQKFWGLVSHTGTTLCHLFHSEVLLLAYPHTNVGPPSLLPCCASSPHQLPISTPPTSLYECFFFNSLVFGLPYSSIFWQFGSFFVFKFVVNLLLVVWGSKVYLPMPPSWPEVPIFFSFSIKVNIQYYFVLVSGVQQHS